MLEGLWSVEVMSPKGGISAGVLVFQPRRLFGDFFEAGRILGGDRNYVYAEDYTIENYSVTGDVKVVHYADDTHPSFGPDRSFRISSISMWIVRSCSSLPNGLMIQTVSGP